MIWCIYCEDRPDGQDLRAETRPAHLGYLSGFDIEAGGPLVGDDGAMVGSCIFLEAPDRAAAEEFAANDPYAKAGLFERVTITGFKKVVWPGQ
ncbi:MAG: YciI family protein [Actinomycetota bacterium]